MAIDNGGKTGKPTHRRKGGKFREMVNQVGNGDRFLSSFLLWEWGFCAKNSSRIDA